MMNYKTELINKILEQRGHEKSSLHYESECIESWINEAKGAYPKLTDYESEWLNYMVEDPIGEFPYETIIDVTDATVDNVVPYAYKSAILKGNTLVNIPTTTSLYVTNKNNGGWVATFEDSDHFVKPNTKYYIGIFNNSSESKNYGLRKDPFTIETKITISPNGYGIMIGTTVENITSKALITNKSEHSSDNDVKILFIEYQEGMENWDISYFEGMMSVQMPVLTTYTHENIFKNYIKDGSQWGKDGNCTTTDIKYSQNGSYVKITGNNSLCFSGFVSPSLPQGTYKFSCKIKVGKVGDSYKILVHNSPNGAGNKTNGFASDKITSTKEIETFEYVGYFANANNMLFYAYYKGQEIEYYDIMFTKLSDDDVTANAQNYTYKSNILTANEEVTLRGFGDVTDELDLLTGELTQRIGEVVFDGSADEGWGVASEGDTINGFSIWKNIGDARHKGLVCDKLSYFDFSDLKNDKTQFISCINQERVIVVNIKGLTSVDEVKQWLSENPITVQYQLATESIKTVDLSVIDQDGNTLSQIKPLEGTMNISTDGTPLKPTVSMEIPVEAITQNLASFVEED